MRLASVYLATNQPVPVLLLPSGNYVTLDDLQLSTFAWSKSWRTAVAHLEIVKNTLEEYVNAGSEGTPPPKTGLKFAPPITDPRAFRDFYAFEAHVKTARARRGLEMLPAWYEIPVFYFSNAASLLGDGASVYAPFGSQELDYELELCAIISRGGRDIPAEHAWEHIAGFTVLNDWSARDLQRKEMSVGLGPAKGKDFATSLGPCILTLDEVQDHIHDGRISLEMQARVNGRRLSHGNARTMHYSWPQLIAQASRDADLFPGDLIGSGTVGTGCILELGPENTGGWLKPGDQVELEIEHLGVLRNTIVPRPD